MPNARSSTSSPAGRKGRRWRPAGLKGFIGRRVRDPLRANLSTWLAIRFSYFIVYFHRGLDGLLDRWGFTPVDVTTIEDLRDELSSFEPDATLGPILAPGDAPRLFELLERLTVKIGSRFPSEVRLSHLPTCGVLEVDSNPWHKRPVLILGLPCLYVWSIDELRAVLAHELTHLRYEDARYNREVLCLVQALRARLEKSSHQPVNVRRRLAWFCVWLVERWAARVSRWMEFRADRSSANACGSSALSAAIEKMAVVQPIFQELLSVAEKTPSANVYRRFARAWNRLRGPTYEDLRRRLVQESPDGDLHPPVAQRIEKLRGMPPKRVREFFPSLHLLDDPSLLERLLHNHLFSEQTPEPTVFERSRLYPILRRHV